MYMWKYYFVICQFFLPIASFAQSKISYIYDSAGNRVRREPGVTVQKAQAKQHDFSLEGTLSDVLCDHSIKIFPSPTAGVFSVSIHHIMLRK